MTIALKKKIVAFLITLTGKIISVMASKLYAMIAQSAGAVEYTDCTSAEHPRHDCLRYDTKQSDGEVPAMLELWGNVEYPFIAIAPRSRMVAPDRVLSMG